MALPGNAQTVVVRGYWWDEATASGVQTTGGRPATVTFAPVPLADAPVGAPNLRDLTASGFIKTRTRIAVVDKTTGYFATVLVASDDPDLDAYAGREVTFLGEEPFTIEVPHDAPTVTVDAALATAVGLVPGSSIKAIWLTDCARVDTPPPPAPINYLSSSQTMANIAGGIEAHDGDPASHPDIRAQMVANAATAHSELTAHATNTSNPHAVTKAQVGLGNADNTSDANKPVSTAQQTALNLKATSFTQSTTKTATYTAADNEVVPLDTTSGAFTLTGPTSGKPFGFRWKAGTTAPTIAAPSGYTISGAASIAPGLAPSGSSGELVLWQAFGTDYQPLGGFKPQLALNAAGDGRYPRVFPVTAYGAVGNGTTDDTTAIQAAIAATTGGGRCYFPPGTYLVTAPLVVPPGVTLEGSHAPRLQYTGASTAPCVLKVAAGFTGAAVIRMLGKYEGGYSLHNIGSRLRRIAIDGTTSPAAVKGVQLFGYVREAVLEQVTVYKATGNAFSCDIDSSSTDTVKQPQSLRFESCVAHQSGAIGFGFNNVPDTTLIDCLAEGNGGYGFYLAGMPNGQLIGCRSEWSGQYGYYITSGFWGSGQGSGGVSLTGCSSDRNNFDGVFIDSTGAAPIQLSNCSHRRDGRAGGTTYAGVRASGATNPVVVDAVTVYPGVNDDGAGTLSPYTGVSATGSTSVTVHSGYLHAATTPVVDGGSNTAFLVPASVGRATGATASPTRTAAILAARQADVQVFTASGTWTKPANAVSVRVEMVGGGGGGGSGARLASGTASSGGASGGGGGYSLATFRAADLAATEAVTVGAGGTGGAAVTVNTTNGNAGGLGGFSAFGSTTTKCRANGGLTAAGGGSTAASTAGSGGRGFATGGGGSAGTVGAVGTQGTASTSAGGGGGSGGGISVTPAAFVGGAGAPSLYEGDTSAGAGAVGGNGGDAVSTVAGTPVGAGGGGGGGSSITAAGGSGGAGGLYGGGGGGGGSSLNGFNSGPGGNGAAGIVVVTTFF